MIGSNPTAMELGLIPCHACGMVLKPAASDGDLHCRRCNARLHLRIPNSTSRCWAFLIAGYILYLPANLLPIMYTGTLSGIRRDTILSGIVYLWESGSWGIAVIVFIASIMVPLLKLLALSFLLISVRGHSPWPQRQRTRLFRLLKLIGRWSMLDIFVAAILTKLVQFRLLATVEIGPAALPFGAVVVLTIIAVMQFDPRLIWDYKGQER